MAEFIFGVLGVILALWLAAILFTLLWWATAQFIGSVNGWRDLVNSDDFLPLKLVFSKDIFRKYKESENKK